jgi:uncharacterized iron-regulated protein
MEEIKDKQVIFFGETSDNKHIVTLQKAILLHLGSLNSARINILLDHFSFEMQYLIDDYVSGVLTFADLCLEYE